MLALHHIYKLSRMFKKGSRQKKKVTQQLVQQSHSKGKNIWDIQIYYTHTLTQRILQLIHYLFTLVKVFHIFLTIINLLMVQT